MLVSQQHCCKQTACHTDGCAAPPSSAPASQRPALRRVCSRLSRFSAARPPVSILIASISRKHPEAQPGHARRHAQSTRIPAKKRSPLAHRRRRRAFAANRWSYQQQVGQQQRGLRSGHFLKRLFHLLPRQPRRDQSQMVHFGLPKPVQRPHEGMRRFEHNFDVQGSGSLKV